MDIRAARDYTRPALLRRLSTAPINLLHQFDQHSAGRVSLKYSSFNPQMKVVCPGPDIVAVVSPLYQMQGAFRTLCWMNEVSGLFFVLEAIRV